MHNTPGPFADICRKEIECFGDQKHGGWTRKKRNPNISRSLLKFDDTEHFAKHTL